MSILGPVPLPTFSPMIQHRRLVAFALADHDGAVEIEFVERLAHRLDRGGVGRLLVAAAGQLRRGDRRRFGDSHHFEHEDTVEQVAGGDRIGRHEGFPWKSCATVRQAV